MTLENSEYLNFINLLLFFEIMIKSKGEANFLSPIRN